MCTVVISFEPGSRFPVLLAGIRDELLDRPWVAPGRHWPDRPELIGGQDLQAGGTWLAVRPDVPRVACVLNGRGPLAPDDKRLSRGELPLRFAADGAGGAGVVGVVDAGGASRGLAEGLDLERYDPFHLVCATLDEVRLLSWNGVRPVEQLLPPGLNMIVNSGLEGADPTPGPGGEEMSARIAYFRPRLADVRRPVPDGGTTAEAWDPWLDLVDGDGLPTQDSCALVVRRDFGDGGIWGTSSISLVGLRPGGVRYDFTGVPGASAAQRNWAPVIS